MGADIYLRSIADKANRDHTAAFQEAVKLRDAEPDETKKEALQEKVRQAYDAMYPDEGYFRDSYNDTSLFWLLQLSWWRDVGDMLDDDGVLPIENARKLLDIIEARPITRPRVEQAFNERELGDTVEEWIQHWTKKRERFIAMLKRSIETDEPLSCSI